MGLIETFAFCELQLSTNFPSCPWTICWICWFKSWCLLGALCQIGWVSSFVIVLNAIIICVICKLRLINNMNFNCSLPPSSFYGFWGANLEIFRGRFHQCSACVLCRTMLSPTVTLSLLIRWNASWNCLIDISNTSSLNNVSPLKTALKVSFQAATLVHYMPLESGKTFWCTLARKLTFATQFLRTCYL